MKRVFSKWNLPIIAMLVFTFLVKNLYAQAPIQDETDRYFEISKNLEIFSNLFKELNQFYVEPIEPGRMIKTGVNAMLEELDPYTVFYTEADVEDFRLQTTGKYGGIGVSTILKDDAYLIVDVHENGPLDKIGIKPGDQIISIDNEDIKGKNQEDIAVLMRGATGTPIKLRIRKAITKEEIQEEIIREDIHMSTVPHFGLMGDNKDIAYIHLAQFMPNSERDVRNALDSMKKITPEMKGVILDLRGNPGGLLDQAVKISNLFIDKNQLVVSTKGKNKEWDREFKTTQTPWDLNIPVTVLINQQSASASEIVAGTLQDLDRAVVLGTRSFGKGLVQNFRNLGYNTRLKVTTAKYFTPSGRCIQSLDYAHKNEDGSVSAIPDSLKQTFYTKAGRSVQDGGGIEPDIIIPSEALSKFTISLLANHYLFDYATHYYHNHQNILPPEKFELKDQDFNQFKSWLDKQDFSYQSQTEELLDKLRTKAEEEGYLKEIEPDLIILNKKLNIDSKNDLENNKDQILKLLTAEITGRYYYEKGKTLNRLNREDRTLNRSLELLNSQAQYQAVLKK